MAKEHFIKFLSDYGIEYNSPVYELATSSEEVKYRLLQLGLSTKSLEGISIFGDSFTTPDDETILNYLREKDEIAREIVAFLEGDLTAGGGKEHEVATSGDRAAS